MTRTITITLNDAQLATMDKLGIDDSWSPLAEDNGGALHLVKIIDDHTVETLMIEKDGTYTHDELEALGLGWNTLADTREP